MKGYENRKSATQYCPVKWDDLKEKFPVFLLVLQLTGKSFSLNENSTEEVLVR